MLINLLLRNFVEHNLIDQAQRLASKTVFPESASNSEAARYLYYIGRIEAIQLEYTSSYANVELALRKAPKAAVGFLEAVSQCALEASCDSPRLADSPGPARARLHSDRQLNLG